MTRINIAGLLLIAALAVAAYGGTWGGKWGQTGLSPFSTATQQRPSHVEQYSPAVTLYTFLKN